jgi:hypothetical protein
MRPVLLLEINEVPWRVIDKYKADGRYPSILKFFSRASTYTTITTEKTGMLDPWITWPTIHRGMGYVDHGVYQLGQDPKTFKGTPIWEEFRRQGHSVGVFGSLQSWPPADPGRGGFYFPDTFAHDERSIPAYLEPFQRFNLGQVARNGRVIKGDSLFSPSAMKLILSLPRLGISVRTVRKLIVQIVSEMRNRDFIARRPIFQSILTWDIFKSLYKPAAPPAFSTFFTNHVASVMHRYWKHVFPEDFGERYREEPKTHAATMDFAMDLVDEILADAIRFCEKNPDLIVVFASSMGQKAIVYEQHEGYEASIPHLDKFMAAFGMKTGEYAPLLAMVPQVAAVVEDAERRQALIEALDQCVTESGKKMFACVEIGSSVSISILTPRLDDIRAGGFRLAGKGVPERRLKWAEAGIAMNVVDPGTAYHFPEGILAVYGRGIGPADARTHMSAADVKGMLMELGGLKRPANPRESEIGSARLTPQETVAS